MDDSVDHSGGQLTIDTPEQVSIRFPIAGMGSRFLAILIDTLLQVAAYGALVLVFILVLSAAPKGAAGELSRAGEKWLVAGLILVHFVMYWGYFTLFEALWNGQTPGKKLFKIRVIQDSGRQITFFEAMIRNLVRAVDLLPSFYLVGVIAMACNRRHKRLGDLAAGTLVVHERASEEPIWGGTGPRTITAAAFRPAEAEPDFLSQHNLPVALPADAIARLSAADLNVIDRFFARALDMDLTTRAQIAARMAGQLAARMNIEAPKDVNPERVLEAIAHELRVHGTRS
ncbi:MAG: RDD family protein [Silvibacterium sp.]|nr:RDD family protein [Silvibacterium sp.]MBV8438244.1 RDD family protein [Silvibacterium sp.]